MSCSVTVHHTSLFCTTQVDLSSFQTGRRPCSISHWYVSHTEILFFEDLDLSLQKMKLLSTLNVPCIYLGPTLTLFSCTLCSRTPHETPTLNLTHYYKVVKPLKIQISRVELVFLVPSTCLLFTTRSVNEVVIKWYHRSDLTDNFPLESRYVISILRVPASV